MTAPLHRNEDRYHNDPAFHAAVDLMQALILDLQLSPSEVREAAMFACYLVELRRPTPPIIIGAPWGHQPLCPAIVNSNLTGGAVCTCPKEPIHASVTWGSPASGEKGPVTK